MSASSSSTMFDEQLAMMAWARSRNAQHPAPPGLTAPGAPARVDAPPGVPVDSQADVQARLQDRLQARLQTVRNMVWIRQVDALAGTYSRTFAALGEARFRRVAAAFVARTPGAFADLEDAGADFASMLRRHVDEHVAALAGLARIEWAIACSFRAADFSGAPLTTAGDCLLALAPATHLVSLDEREVPAVHAAFPDIVARAAPLDLVLVHRTEERVRVAAPTDDERSCLEAASSGAAFTDLCATFAAEPAQLAHTLGSLLQRQVIFLRRPS